MRDLNKRQKEMIREAFKRNPYLVDIMGIDDLEKIYDVNPHETFYHNANRFLWDIRFEKDEDIPW